jgi:hypothetical protein
MSLDIRPFLTAWAGLAAGLSQSDRTVSPEGRASKLPKPVPRQRIAARLHIVGMSPVKRKIG